jgi:predicted enzyme related to lactoylglutathione lyase
MTSVVRNITFDCAPPYEPYDLARFWSEVVGRPVDPHAATDDDEVAVTGTPRLLFVRVPEAKTDKNRVHVDLQPDQPRDAEVERLSALGAKLIDDQRLPDGGGWVVLADPAGNEFCVTPGAAGDS